MSESHKAVFGTAPWPKELGNAANSNTAPVQGKAIGWPQRRAPLPVEGSGGIPIVAAGGRCFVTRGRHLVAVDPEAEQAAWTVTLPEGGFLPSTLADLADGRLIVCEGRGVGKDAFVVRSQATGEELARFPLHTHLACSGVTPGGQLIYEERLENNEKVLRMLDLNTGEVLWSQLIASGIRPGRGRLQSHRPAVAGH